MTLKRKRTSVVRPAPVLRRKGVHGEPLEPELDGPLRRVQQSFLAGPVTLGARQARLVAQRPFPSMTHATWRGIRFGSSPSRSIGRKATCPADSRAEPAGRTASYPARSSISQAWSRTCQMSRLAA